ncbi:hypothetical protein [Actinoplanes philippinensis]|uniref:hypothetical protein n=1 Tax=Actinoplanes philippinensis TaxID=35752 RepID=UPI0033E92A69
MRDALLKLVRPQDVGEVGTQLTEQLEAGVSLLSAAVRLGVSAETAVHALIRREGERAVMDLASLKILVGKFASNRTTSPEIPARSTDLAEGDLSLAQVATALGFDLDEIRQDMRNGTLKAQYSTS